MSINKVQEVENFLNRNLLAVELCNNFTNYMQLRSPWEAEKRELREFIFATDTTKTSNRTLPWKNSTVRPKLCQIRDNLHANYMAALFPNDNWLEWTGKNLESVTKEKKDAIEQYMYSKIQESQFVKTVSELVLDYIDYGNAFADVVFVDNTIVNENGEIVSGYRGPKLVRVSPFDIAFDVTGKNFDDVPKYTREIVQLGELRKRALHYPDLAYQSEVVDHLRSVRAQHKSLFAASDINKNAGFIVDGFSTLTNYYDSGYVELITFEGDAYDVSTDTLYENKQIVIADRSYIVAVRDLPSWSGKSYKKHVGWRLRPDNLMAMGPLDNLVGMQYRIDHIENLKADMFDLMAHPPLLVKGYVEDFDWEPFERIQCDNDSTVETLRIDSSALQANFEIDKLEFEMEQMAGAPREAAGIRTPGEKTAFEVGALANAASRIFQNKVQYFEENFIEPLLNSFLEVSRRNIEGTELIRNVDEETSAVNFMRITKEDLTAVGTVRARGARHYATRAQLIQELTTLLNSAVAADEDVKVHISGKAIAEMIEDVMGLHKYDIVKPYIRVYEQYEKQELINTVQETLSETDSTPEVDPEEERAAAEARGATLESSRRGI